MCRGAVFVLGLAWLAAASSLPAQAMPNALPLSAGTLPVIKVGYYCSPGFVASYGRCIATASTDEVDLYLNDPQGYDLETAAPLRTVRHRHRRHGIHARY